MTPYTRRITLCEKACRCYLHKNCMTSLNRTTYTFFRWGGFPPWDLDLPIKGDKVVFLYNDGFQSFMYLMKTIAIGEQSVPFLEDIDELHQVDDCTVYVLSNVVGPVIIDNSELKLPKELLKGKYQPDERVSQPLSDKLMEIFIGHQYSTHINEL